jgi:hypothetical protein
VLIERSKDPGCRNPRHILWINPEPSGDQRPVNLRSQ